MASAMRWHEPVARATVVSREVFGHFTGHLASFGRANTGQRACARRSPKPQRQVRLLGPPSSVRAGKWPESRRKRVLLSWRERLAGGSERLSEAPNPAVRLLQSRLHERGASSRRRGNGSRRVSRCGVDARWWRLRAAKHAGRSHHGPRRAPIGEERPWWRIRRLRVLSRINDWPRMRILSLGRSGP